MLHSDKVPDVTYSPDINKLFYFFGINWETLSPALYVLFGVLFGFFVLKIMKNRFFGD